ncbi:MAG: amidohydrolase family protein [Treponema sp.]|nr:amidohydrolase family protein [Treponema sp.]
MIIDFHAHIYPEKIAEKATKAISTFYENAPMRYHGSSTELLLSGAKIGVEHYVVHSTATKEAQVESINNFIIDETQKHKEFVGFGTMHPNYANFEQEISRIKNAGLKGIKLHPDFQQFQIDDPKMDNLYECFAAADLPVLIHAGDYRFDFSGPVRIRNVIDKHPNLTVIAAHFGGYTEWDDAIEYLVGQNIYFDTSSTLWKLPLETAQKMIYAHGVEHFLFGTDFPMWDHEQELKSFKTLGLSPDENEAILYTNAKKLLKL